MDIPANLPESSKGDARDKAGKQLNAPYASTSHEFRRVYGKAPAAFREALHQSLAIL